MLESILTFNASSTRVRRLAVLGSPCGLGIVLALVWGLPTRLQAQQGFEQGTYQPLVDVLLVNRPEVRVIANGAIAVSAAGSSFEATVDENDELDSVNARVGLRGALTVELAAEGSGELTGDFELVNIPLPPFAAGPMLTVAPYAQVRLLLSGTTDAGARISMVAPFEVGASFRDARSRSPDLSSQPQFEPRIGTPEVVGNLNATVEIEVTMTFLMTVSGTIPVGGPVLGSRFGAALDVDIGTASWQLGGIGSIIGGWAFPDPLTGTPNILDDVLRVELTPWPIAQGSIAELASLTRWSRVYDVRNDDEGAAGVMVGQELFLTELADEPWLASFDELGVPRWQSIGTTFWLPVAMVRAEDGDLLVAGSSTGRGEMRVERYAPSGAPRWRSRLSVPGAGVSGKAIVPSASNGATLVGAVSYVPGTSRPIVAAIDEFGNVSWSSELEFGPGASEPTIDAVAETSAGELLAVGTVEYVDPTGIAGGQDALLVRLDNSGQPLAAHAMGSLERERAHHVVVRSDGGFDIAGEYQVANAWLASFSADDNLRWSGFYQSRPDADNNGEQAVVTSIAALTGHGLLVSGTTGSSDVDAWVMEVDQGGMPYWLKTYRSSDVDRLLQVIPLGDGLMALGSTGIMEATGSYEDIWLLRASVDGQIRFQPGSGLATESTAVQWQAIHGQTLHTLTPTTVATATLGSMLEAFSVDAADAVGELVSE